MGTFPAVVVHIHRFVIDFLFFDSFSLLSVAVFDGGAHGCGLG